MIDFSVVIPVRNNLKGLSVTLGAFELFTAQKDKLEIILVCDNDDKDLVEYMEMASKYSFRVIVCAVEKSDNFSRDYYNHGLTKASGDKFMVYNDDCYMQTNQWDDIVRRKVAFNKFNDIFLVDTWDSTRTCEANGAEFPRFPIISRKAVDLLGFFFYPLVRMWPADYLIWQIYSYAGCIIPCHEVKMQHDHNYNHKTDPSKMRMLRIMEEDKANGVFPVKADEYISKLRAAMGLEWANRPDAETPPCGNRR
jgi:glycosyltransferase involved in cell wall biosynthesis